MFYDDTIAAVVTASVNSGVSILRISGEDAVPCADQILQFKNKTLADCKSHTVNYGFVVNEKSEIIDEVIVLLMKAPNSYTKEDVVEIQCHGGTFLCHEILELILSHGVRIAEPGEFTKRAFLNGRIDLSQAEAVMDLIESKSRYAMENSVNQLKGTIKEKIVHIRSDILNDVAYIEAALDDPEHISLEDFSEDFETKIKDSLSELKKICDNYDNGRMIREGVQTVIIGRPNVGKSSFLNSILGMERAIVTDVPGTTRDTLEEDVRLGDLFLHLIDTAGIHDTEDKVEKIGIEKAKENIDLADFCILIIDGSEKLTDDDIFLMKEISDKNAVILLNKNDLELVVDESEIRKYTDKKIISFSAKTNDGSEQLEEYIKKQFYLEKISFNDEIYLSNERQKQAVAESVDSLEHVMESIRMNLGEDFYTIDLMNAYESLGKIIGESVDDDLIDTIFRKFCMGK
ncbi:MAG: tRNA uridine-5-carboxymethylaminomethyl(34) synthesis GTPase MnmE [Roseburia sp.]|nr:tRNA uridine-5-carboxymethylaminomethyl(34) synthesis GTPase MnmE [Roseburia sp.]